MKFSNVALGVSVPPLLDEVTDVVPREVTPPVTVCVRLVLSAPEVVAAMSVEWVCVELPGVEVTPPPVYEIVVVVEGNPDVVAAGLTECVWSPCVETAIVSA